MFGSEAGFQSSVEVTPEVIWTEMIHRQALLANTLPESLKEVSNRVTKAVNAVKSRLLEVFLYEQKRKVPYFPLKVIETHLKPQKLKHCLRLRLRTRAMTND